MELSKILEGIKYQVIKGGTDIDIVNLAYDSRKVSGGYLFICIEGFKTDGHNFIGQAVRNGAAAIVVQNDVAVEDDITVIRVEDTRKALAFEADRYFGHPSGKFHLIGITGTKGKTTTTFMIKSILEAASEKVGLVGTIANMIGNTILPAERTTPESYDLQALFSDMLEKNVNSVVMEVSSHALELQRVGFCDFNTGVFTNLSRDHLDFHETFDNYLSAKLKLFEMCDKGLVNIDNEYGREAAGRIPGEFYTYGIESEADIKAENVRLNSDSVEFGVRSRWFSGDIKVNVPGRFTVYNALAAIGVCHLKGIPLETIKKGLINVSVPGRVEVVNTGRDFTVIIDYAHSPDSLENVLTTVNGFKKGRMVCLFGCGGDRDRTKRPIMGEIAGKMADFTVITSDNPRTEDPSGIVDEIEEGIKKTEGAYIKIVDRREAIKYALENARADDIIVLAGKGHETYQIFKDKTIHFDEREVVSEILAELG